MLARQAEGHGECEGTEEDEGAEGSWTYAGPKVLRSSPWGLFLSLYKSENSFSCREMQVH